MAWGASTLTYNESWDISECKKHPGFGYVCVSWTDPPTLKHAQTWVGSASAWKYTNVWHKIRKTNVIINECRWVFSHAFPMVSQV